MKTFNYFAYGSNMDKDYLDQWCRDHNHPIIEFLDIRPAILEDYKLCFNYYSEKTWQAGAANIIFEENSKVYGLLIRLDEKDKYIIRKKEGYPNYYSEIPVTVKTFDNEIVNDVLTYKVVKGREKSEHQPPTKYYMGLIINNAKKYGFPIDYINYLESIVTKPI